MHRAIAEHPRWPSHFQYKELDNGLAVLVVQDKSVPIATIEYVVHNGAFTETEEYDGLSHLYEHMFFKANQDYPSQEAFLDRVKELGIVFNGTTSLERVNYFVTLGQHRWKEGLSFMASAIRYPGFDQEEMKRENEVVAAEFQRLESNPVYFLHDDLSKKMWGGLYSRKNTIGNYDVILSATPEIMRSIQARYYHPNNSLIIVSGDVDAEEVFTECQRQFGDWKHAGFDPIERYAIPEFPALSYSKSYVTRNENAQVPIAMAAFSGPNTKDTRRDTYIADVFSFITAQKNSSFQQKLVESGVCLQAGLSYSTLRYGGTINGFVVPNPTMVEEALAAFKAELAETGKAGYFTQEQLDTAKEMLENQHLLEQEQTSSFSRTLSYWWCTGGLDYYLDYQDEIASVTLSDLEEFAKKYIVRKPNVLGLLTSDVLDEQHGIGNLVKETFDIDCYRITQDMGTDLVNSRLDSLKYWQALNPGIELLAKYANRNAVEPFMQQSGIVWQEADLAEGVLVDFMINS